ncbi:BON domain-containing protein [Candidatus Dojkabacteria bacterium]|nr:BON domain-containing protein [Candidatus Dojkabacteria bacterium]
MNNSTDKIKVKKIVSKGGEDNTAGFWKAVTVFIVILLIGWIVFYYAQQSKTLSEKDISQTVSEITDEEKNVDVQIKEDIENQLIWDPRVFSDNVAISVNEGKVTLSGTVPSFEAKKGAGESTLDVEGVVSVDNELTVQYADASKIPENEILWERVNDALRWNTDLEQYDIEATVDEGVVTLEGTVDTLQKKTKAQEIVYAISGVHDVDNQLAIVFTEYFSDERIAEDIVDTLERNLWIDEEDVDVKVTSGFVTLTGKVSSYREYDKAEEIASFTMGVVEVENNLEVSLY